ncbi:MAG: hypothetical protein FVQ83_12090 [Chloroflexi bacterium]|nr:hypothetical protein [Chloroflexota bacterium]
MLKRNGFKALLNGGQMSRGFVWGLLIIGALLAFEIFNYSTTDFAMTDLLGDLSFGGLRWATILAIAFCGIDFAGIARLFTPEQGSDEPTEVWYLFGAWLLAATMNALLTWWGVSIAILSHGSLGNAVIPRETLLQVVPIFVAVMVWLIRILIIGTFSVAGDRLFSQADKPEYSRPRSTSSRSRTLGTRSSTPAPRRTATSFRPSQKRTVQPEATYHPVTMKSGSSSRQTMRD